MTYGRLLARRVALGILAAWVLLTAVFVAFRATENWQLLARLGAASSGGASMERLEEIRREYLRGRDLEGSLLDQYVDWMGNMVTFQWGESLESGREVLPLVASGAATTASYVLPAVALGMTVALAVGLYSALHEGSRRERGLRGVVYLGLGLPSFWVGAFLLVASGLSIPFGWGFESTRSPVELPLLFQWVLPVVLVATTFVAAVASYARAYSLQYATGDVAKLVRAKGGGRRAVARHVLRNAAIPIVSLAFTETLALLALSVFVIESLFGLEGLGLLFYNAVWTRDLPILMGVSLVFIAAAVAGNVLQDVAYETLDPRVDTGAR